MKRGATGRYAIAFMLSAMGIIGVTVPAYADSSSSTNYKLDASVNNNFGSQSGSTNYSLVDSGGESVIGNGASGSYILVQGYTSQPEQSIQLTAPTTIGLGTVTAGSSKTANGTLSVVTDASGYTIAVQQNTNLQSGSNTIPAVSGTIASPTAWIEGTTKGLGLTLTTTNATALPSKWSSGTAYGALPTTSTSLYTRTGSTAGATDTLGVRFRLDVAPTQASGSYSNIVTWTGTITP